MTVLQPAPVGLNPLPHNVVQAETLRLLSLNVQVGISNHSLQHYISSLWQHILPSRLRMPTLDKVGGLLSAFDLVALQEVDGGSFRSGFQCQARFLSQQGGLNHWHVQTNRDMGFWAQHSNAVLSRHRMESVIEHTLPGLVPGRGAIEVDVILDNQPVTIVIAHLALGKRTRMQQLQYLADLLQDRDNAVLMGDFNASTAWLLESSPLANTQLSSQVTMHTYPSWRPKKDLDHILVTPSLMVSNYRVLEDRVSDHLPVAMDISIAASQAIPGHKFA